MTLRPVPKLVSKIVLLFAPLLCGLMLIFGLTIHLGEMISTEEVTKIQMKNNEPLLYGPSDPSRNFSYKLAGVDYRHPQFMVFGSSRVMPYRSEILNKNPSVFYNAGSTAWELEEFVAFVRHLDKSNAPSLLLLGVDQFWFNDENKSQVGDDYDPFNNLKDIVDLNRLTNSSRSVLLELFRIDALKSGAFTRMLDLTEPNFNARALGTIAISRGIGFRNDGSIQRGPLSADVGLAQQAISEDFQTAQNGVGGIYGSGANLSETKLQQLQDALQKLHDLNVLVIGFAPPYAPNIWDEMTQDGKHEYLVQYRERMPALFEQYSFPFVDISDAKWVGGTVEEMYDGSHVTELLMLRTYIYLLKQLPEVLGKYSDLEYLENLVSNAKSTFYVFDR